VHVFRASYLDFKIVIAGTEGPDLVVTAVDCTVADFARIRPGHASPLLGALQVLFPSVAVFHAPARSQFDHATELVFREPHES